MALTDDQVALLQAFIDDAQEGTYDAMDLIPEDQLEYFSAPQVHGSKFAEAVNQKRLKGVELIGMHPGSKHLRYRVEKIKNH